MKKISKKKNNYGNTLAHLYAWLSFGCFGIVILQPMWHYNHDTISAAIYVLIGWFSAIAATKIGD